MLNVKQEIQKNGFVAKGNIVDILTYLELEQQRFGKISVLKYVKRKRDLCLIGNTSQTPSYKGESNV